MLIRITLALLCLMMAAPVGAQAGGRDRPDRPRGDASAKRHQDTLTRFERAHRRTRLARASGKRTAKPAPAAQPLLFGYSDIAVQTGQVTAPVHASLAAAGGAKSHRITFDWRWAEQQRGTFKFATYDSLYDSYVAAGMKPVFVVLYSPQWSWAAGTSCVQATQDCRLPPGTEHMDGFRNMLQTLVKRYPKMAALEIWNEPNMKLFWQSGADPAHYARMIKEADAALAQIGSSIPVLGGSVTVPPEGEGNLAPRDFLAGMYANGVKGHMDGLAIHPYPYDVDLWQTFRTLTTAREVRDANGDSATPIWITEIGASRAHGGTSAQARVLERLVRRFGADPDVRSMLVHSLVQTKATDPIEAGYGIVDLSLNLSPAYCTLASVAGLTAPCLADAVVRDEVQEKRWRAQELLQDAAEAAVKYRKANGSYTGLTSAKLAALDPDLSATAPSGTVAPGAGADPSQIGVYVWGTPQHMEVCNTSQADRSYCIHTIHGQYWDYGSALGTINQAAGATNNRTSTTW